MTGSSRRKENGIHFSCWIGEQDVPVQPGTGIWNDAFPIRLNAGSSTIPITYGDYFQGVQVFLETDGGARLYHAMNRFFEASPPLVEMDGVAIHLIKHGEFYHPGRIDVHMGKRIESFLVNVALSQP